MLKDLPSSFYFKISDGGWNRTRDLLNTRLRRFPQLFGD